MKAPIRRRRIPKYLLGRRWEVELKKIASRIGLSRDHHQINFRHSPRRGILPGGEQGNGTKIDGDLSQTSSTVWSISVSR
jgi:hypothetical protein